MNEYNLYCDESCHLEHDNHKAMVIGSIICPKSELKRINEDIRNIIVKHGLSENFEIKWTKVSNSKIDFYSDLIKYFFNENELMFRGFAVPDKANLRHSDFHQTHDEFYYKMYYETLIYWGEKISSIDRTSGVFNIYLDLKDTLGGKRVDKLHSILNYKFKGSINKIQLINSKESPLIQVADLLIGAIAYELRNLNSNEGKLKLVKLTKDLSNTTLRNTVNYSVNKFNLMIFNG